MECSDEACVIKITLMFSFDNTSKRRFEEPEIPIIPEPSSVNKAILSIWLIPFIGLDCNKFWLEMYVPSAFGSNVFLIKIGIFLVRTG